MLTQSDPGSLPADDATIPASGEEGRDAAASLTPQPAIAGPPMSARDTEPDRPYTFRLNKVVMRDFESWAQARGKRKKPVIEAALREYMARHSAD